MRYLILMRGIPGSGKSTWLENNNFGPFTLSTDKIRLMLDSIQLTKDGRSISTRVNKETFEILRGFLEHRMEKGVLTFVDATHANPKDLKLYKNLAEKYRYKVIVVQFDTPLDIAKKWNRKRADWKIVPEHVLERMNENMKKPLPKYFNVVKPIDFDEHVRINPINLEEYENVHFIGDLQGCYTVLETHFKNNPITDKDFYIFLGDLCDRGIENDKVLKFALSLKDNKNVAWVWGNHEDWLWNWSSKEDGLFLPNEFLYKTQPQLEKAGIDKKEVRKFLRQFHDVMWVSHKGKMFLVSHAGISTLKYALPFISSRQFIKGVGRYKDPVDEWFSSELTEKDPVCQVHGHRNEGNLPIQAATHGFVLENDVEWGGTLRILTHIGKGEFNAHDVVNRVYDKERKNPWKK